MSTLKTKLEKVRTTFEAKRLLRDEFLRRNYPKTRKGASEFQKDLERKYPGINKWVLGWNRETGREIEDVMMDEFEISGDSK